MKLSILIPTVVGREQQFDDLCSFLQWQIDMGGYGKDVEIVSEKDNKEISIGAKRNKLLDKAKGEYCVMIDDDDTVHYQYIAKVLEGLKESPDCIGYKELCIYEGKSAKTSNISLRYKQWQAAVGSQHLQEGFNHYRSTFYKVPIRTELCRQVRFKDLRFGEDHDFAGRLAPLLKNEVYIDEFMYIYKYNATPHRERYGINR